MKIIFNEDKIIIYLNKENTKFVLNEDDSLKHYFQNLFYKLKKHFNIETSNFYNIDVFCDEYYGYVLEITASNLYYDYFDQIDMQINIIKSLPFLYEIDYSFLNNLNLSYYKKGSKIYLKPNNQINSMKFGQVIEYSKIIYGDEIENIINNSEKVNVWKSQL